MCQRGGVVYKGGGGGEGGGEGGGGATYVSLRKRKIMLRGRCLSACWLGFWVPWCLLVDLPDGGLLHQRMREADFGTVDGAIAGCFDEGEDFGVLRVTDESIDSILRVCRISIVRLLCGTIGTLAYLQRVHLGCPQLKGAGAATLSRAEVEGMDESYRDGKVMSWYMKKQSRSCKVIGIEGSGLKKGLKFI